MPSMTSWSVVSLILTLETSSSVWYLKAQSSSICKSRGSIISSYLGEGWFSKNSLGSMNLYDWIWEFKSSIPVSYLSTTISKKNVLASGLNFIDFKISKTTPRKSSSS